jgi:hypothetical protein
MTEMQVEDVQTSRVFHLSESPCGGMPSSAVRTQGAFCAGFRIQLEIFYGLLALSVGAS